MVGDRRRPRSARGHSAQGRADVRDPRRGHGAAIAYLPDHDPTADFEPGAKLARGADVLLHDAQFARSERAIATAYGHATVDDAVELAERAGVARLVLIHHAPSRTDQAAVNLSSAAAETASMPLTLGREGTEFEC
jgi:ribonuclease BN (tRNA processing enzyme)